MVVVVKACARARSLDESNQMAAKYCCLSTSNRVGLVLPLAGAQSSLRQGSLCAFINIQEPEWCDLRTIESDRDTISQSKKKLLRVHKQVV